MHDWTETDRAWLAGLLEGEGSFLQGPPSNPRSPIVSLQMSDEDVVARAAAMLSVRYWRIKPRKEHWKDTYKFQARGNRAMAAMASLYELMGIRRKSQIDKARACYEPTRAKFTDWNIPELLVMRETMSLRQMAKVLRRNHETIRKQLQRIAA